MDEPNSSLRLIQELVSWAQSRISKVSIQGHRGTASDEWRV